MRKSTVTNKSEQIARLISDAGEAGILSTDIARITGSSAHNTSSNVHTLRVKGLAFSASNVNCGRARIFARKEWADAYAAQPLATHQTCKKCGFSKLLAAFSPAPTMRSGRESVCRDCRVGRKPDAVKPVSMARRLVDIITKANGQPITSAEIGQGLGLTRSQASGKLSEAIRRGQVHGLRVGGVWFAFGTSDEAKAYPLAQLEERARELTGAHRQAIAAKLRKPDSVRAKAAKRDQNTIVRVSGVDAPVKLSKAAIRAPEGEGVITEHTKITRIPSFDYSARFRPEPGFVGVFSKAGIGRDVNTGKGWA